MTEEFASYDEVVQDVRDIEIETDDDGYTEAEREALSLVNRAQRRKAAKVQRSADYKTALRREAEGVEYLAIDFDGHTYWAPADPQDWPIEALLAFEDGKAVTALRGILSVDEDGRGGFDDLLKRGYRIRQLTELYQKVAEVGGFETAGN